MSRIIVALALCGLANIALAQKNSPEKYAALITGAGLKERLTIIASDSMEGRETGTAGQRRAAAYIESRFKTIGLNMAPGMTSYQQYYPLYQDSITRSDISIGGINAVYGTDYLAPAVVNQSATIHAGEIIFAGYGIDDKKYSDYTGIDVRGKIVLMLLGEPKADGKFFLTGSARPSEWTYPGISKKLALAYKKGAAAVFVINPAQADITERQALTSKKSQVYFPRKKDTAADYALISYNLARRLMGAQFDSVLAQAKAGAAFTAANAWKQQTQVSFDYQKGQTVINASNVIGIVEGTDKKDEYVFLTGHYDHLGLHDGKIYYGADDDGSGTVGVLEMANAFAKAKADGHGPRRTVVFMTVSGEEKGLWGSEYYSDHPIFPIEKTSVDLNTDMVGRIDTERKLGDTLNYVYVVGHDKLSTDLPHINEAVNATYTGLTLDYKFDDPKDPERIYFRSDHYNFARKGIPVLFFYDGMLKADYHKPTDTIDKINWPLYEKRVRMIFHTAWEMANRDAMLKRDLPIPTATR